jgi:hypothetical protein
MRRIDPDQGAERGLRRHFRAMARQDGSVRFAALAEKSADVAVKRLDTNFIDQLGRTTGYLMQLFVFGVAA